MADASPTSVEITIDASRAVSALLLRPPSAFACLALAHGAGAGMTHPFMIAVATGLSRRGVATLRFQFPYMQARSRRPDRPAIAHATIRAAVAEAAAWAPDLPLFAGGKSFGARMTSQAQAEAALPMVNGLVFLGFPLHPSNKPSGDRASHLSEVHVPMLFIQGTRDSLAHTGLLRPIIDTLGPVASLALIEQGDHSFHVPVRSGRTDPEVLDNALDTIAGWMRQVLNLS